MIEANDNISAQQVTNSHIPGDKYLEYSVEF